MDDNKYAILNCVVIGVGAIGSALIQCLLQVSISKLVLIDNDFISANNIKNSKFFTGDDIGLSKVEVIKKRIYEQRPELDCEVIHGFFPESISLKWIHEADLIFSCVDNLITRLQVNRVSFQFNKTWVNAGTGKNIGRVEVYKYGYSCFECQLTEIEKQNINMKLSCADIVYPLEDNNSNEDNVEASLAMIVAKKQCKEAVSSLKSDYTYHNFIWNDSDNEWFAVYESKALSDCDCYGLSIEEVIEVDISIYNTVRQLFNYLKKRKITIHPVLHIRHDIILSYHKGGNIYEGCIPLIHARKNTSFRNIQIIESSNRIDEHFRYLDSTMAELAIVKGDIISVFDNNKSLYLQLNYANYE